MITPGLDYTDKDFDALRARLFNLVRSAHPEWTDTQAATFGNILLESFCFIGDVLTYYQDKQARESRLTTAQLRSSMLAHSKLLSYRPKGAQAATTELTLTLAEVPVGNVVINAGDRFRTQKVTDPVTFQALSAVTIPAGADPPTIVFDVEHSSNSEQIFQSTALPNQELLLGDTPFLDGSLSIVAPGYSGFGLGFGMVAPMFHGIVSVPTTTPSWTIQFLVTASVLRMPVLVKLS